MHSLLIKIGESPSPASIPYTPFLNILNFKFFYSIICIEHMTSFFLLAKSRQRCRVKVASHSLGFRLPSHFCFISPLSNFHNFSCIINPFYFLTNYFLLNFQCIYAANLFFNQWIYVNNYSL